MHAISVLQLVKYAIAADNNEIVLVAIDVESSDIWVGDHNPIISF